MNTKKMNKFTCTEITEQQWHDWKWQLPNYLTVFKVKPFDPFVPSLNYTIAEKDEPSSQYEAPML